MKFGNNNNKTMSNLMYGRNPALSYMDNKKVTKVYLQTGFSDAKILKAIKDQNIKTEYVDQRKLQELSNNGNHQGIVCEIEEYRYSSINEIVEVAKKQNDPIVLILDGIEDPHNLGAILRSADAFNVAGVILKDRNQVQINMTVAKVSTGAINHVKVAQVSNLNNAIEQLKKNGFWIYAADGLGKDNYNDLKYDGPVGLIMGSEGFGISRLLLSNSDFVLKIPMYGHVNSLNVSVATGILLSRIRNK